MRMLKLMICLFVLGAGATAAEPALIPDPLSGAYRYDADYYYDGGQISMSVERQFQFRYVGGKVDENNQLKADAAATMTQFVDIDQIRGFLDNPNLDADYVAEVEDRISKYGNKWPIDCRKVAHDMVINMIDSRIQITNGDDCKASDGQCRHYQDRNDLLDVTLMARHLSSIQILKADPKRGASFECHSAPISDGYAKCGDLKIWYNPKTPDKGEYKGKKVFAFSPKSCRRFIDNGDEDLKMCELNAQVTACGMRGIQKETKENVKNGILGLSDYLERVVAREVVDRSNGVYFKAAPRGPVAPPVPTERPDAGTTLE